MPSGFPDDGVDPIPVPDWTLAPGQPARLESEFLTDVRDSTRAAQAEILNRVPKDTLAVDSRDFGLTPTGDNTAALQLGINEAAVAGVEFRVQAGTWPTESPLSNPVGRLGLVGAGITQTVIRNDVTDVFVCAAGQSDGMTMRGLTLQGDSSTGGHAFYVPDGVTLVRGKFEQVQFYQRNAASSAIKVVSATGGGVFDTTWDTCWIRALTAAGQQSPVHVVTGGTRFNTNLFTKLRCEFTAAGPTVPFFYIECSADQIYNSGNRFAVLNMERCDGGYFDLRRDRGFTFDTVVGYDTGTTTGHGWRLERSRHMVFVNCDRRGGTLGSGMYDVYCDTTGTAGGARTAYTTVIGQGAGNTMSYNFQDTPATVIGGGGATYTGTAATTRISGEAVGFNGAAPVGKRTLGAAATDAATTQTLANNLRQALIDLGLGQT